MRLQIQDHARFQSAVARSVAVGAAVALLFLIQWKWVGATVAAGGILALGVAAVPPRSWRSLAVAASVAALATFAGTARWPLSAMVLAGIGAWTFAREVRGVKRRLVAVGVGAVAMALGAFVASRLDLVSGMSSLPPALELFLLGGAFGFFFGLGTLGRELELVPETAATVIAAATGVRPSGELGVLLGRASQAHREAQGALGSEAAEVNAAASDLMSKIERFATRWSDLELELGRTDRAALEQRLAEVSQREAAATDEVVREEYASARAALEKQVEYVEAIQHGRERAVARLHHHVAVLERLRYAALHHRAVAAGRAGEDLSPLVEDLVAAGRDLDCASEAIVELPHVSVN